jgi:hypothetical protein
VNIVITIKENFYHKIMLIDIIPLVLPYGYRYNTIDLALQTITFS